MTHVAALLPVLLTSSLLGCTAAHASILCSWTKVSPDHKLHYSFLWSDPQSPASARLYHSSWSGGRVLLDCAWTKDAGSIRNYLSLCRERPQEFSDPPNKEVDLDLMFEAEHCVSLPPEPLERAGRRDRRDTSDETSEVRTLLRVRRGIIVPGTLWCGAGSKAPSYADLGIFSDTDSCCREHDQCKHSIPSFQSDFGVFNSNIFTMSHCDCDQKFRWCLRKANDSISDVVEYTFFNLLKMHCFTLSHQLQCTERHWFGMCKKFEMALYADVQPPVLEESLQPKACRNSSCTDMNSTLPAELLESSASGPRLLSTTVQDPVTSSPSITGPEAPSESPTGSEPERGEDLERAKPQNNNPTEQQVSCDVYQELDECRSKILPHQKKYGLRNTEPRTLYHCNCTSRLFQTLAQQSQVTKVQAVLLEQVSLSCFLPEDCQGANSSCTPVVVKVELLGLDQRTATVGEQHHLQAVKLKIRRQNTRAKTKDRRVRLWKLCQRLTGARQTEKVWTRRPRRRQAVRGTRLSSLSTE